MNRIGWCDITKNPVVGCTIGCPYCYGPGQACRNKRRCPQCGTYYPHPHLERLDQLTPRQKPQRVFINSLWDWNDDAVKPEWLDAIITKMRETPQHLYLVLSKRPEGYDLRGAPSNVMWGASVTGLWDIERLDILKRKKEDAAGIPKIFVSFEPLIQGVVDWSGSDDPLGEFEKRLKGVDWVILGGLSRPGKDPAQPAGYSSPDDPSPANEIVATAKALSIPVYIKDNLTAIDDRLHEFPPMPGVVT